MYPEKANSEAKDFEVGRRVGCCNGQAAVVGGDVLPEYSERDGGEGIGIGLSIEGEGDGFGEFADFVHALGSGSLPRGFVAGMKLGD